MRAFPIRSLYYLLINNSNIDIHHRCPYTEANEGRGPDF
jgi:hypothetical protein